MRKNNRKRIISTVIVGAMLCAGAAFGTVKYINHDNGGNGNNGTSETTVSDKSGDVADAEQTVYMTDFQKENAQKEKEIVADKVEDKKDTLDSDQGLYAPDSIVLSDTTKGEAERIAEKLGADVRLTDDGSFAVLYLPEGMTIDDVYNNDEYSQEITEMTPDYYVSVSELNEELGGAVNSTPDNSQSGDEDSTQSTSKVISARPDYTANDPDFRNQQYFDYINLKNIWNTTKGSGVTVAVIDSGIDTDHPEFKGRISEKSYNASEDKIVKDYDMSVIEDEQGHGTKVAGVLAASMDNNEGIAGVAPEVELLVIKCNVGENGEFARGSDIVFGLAYAIESDVDVINMSLASEVDIYSKYTQLAVDSDIVCVASAGNDGSNIPVYPASLDSVIAVGAYDTESGTITDYSNYGENVDILAPGTTYTTDIGGYTMATGTSMSAPIAAGAVALYKSACGKTEFEDMRQLFEASSVDLGIAGEDYYNGFGEVDVYALVCEEKGKITYDMLTDEVKNQTQIFVKGHTVQTMPEPEREYLVFDGWYFDPNCEDVCELYTNVFSQDVTLYASWVNEDDGTAFTYVKNSDGTIRITSYTGKRRYVTVPSEIEGEAVTEIGENAFENNRRARSITLPDTLKNIRTRAFYNCTYIRSVDIPDSVSEIGDEAFSGCVRLGAVDVSDSSGLMTVGAKAFSFAGISEFNIPSSLISLGDRVFYGSTGLRKIKVADGNPSYLVKNSALYSADGTTLLYYPAGLAGTYTVDASTKTIGTAAFAYSRSGEVVLNEGLANVGEEGFAYSRIDRVEFPESLTSLGESAYSNCSRLSDVAFPENGQLKSIPENGFSSTYALREITMPKYITGLNGFAFYYSGLTKIEFADDSQLSDIGAYAFAGSNIKDISIPNSVKSIGGYAFYGIGNLASVRFGEKSKCTNIDAWAFAYTYSLGEFLIPDSVTTIGDTALYNSGITKIGIGVKLTNIGSGVFASCHNLSDITVDEKNEKYSSYEGVLYNKDKSVLMLYPAARTGSYTMADTTVKIDRYAFSGALGLTEVIMNEGLTDIGENAFEYCEKLQTPTLPSTLTEIDGYAFMWCSGMSEKLTIPKNVKSISWYAFGWDFALTDIEFEPESALDRIGYGTFAYCGIEDFTIPGNVTTIAQEAFTGCNKLLTVTFEADSRLVNLPAWCFSGADNLRRITFEEGSALQTIEARACEGLLHLEGVDFSGCKKLATIDNYAFKSCISLGNLSIPDTVNDIGRYAFYGCSQMDKMILPETLNHIGRYAFSKTKSINIYFMAAVLPSDLEDKWDDGIGAYYVGLNKIHENDEWVYAVTNDGTASVIKYKGNAENIVLDNIDGYAVSSIGSETFKDNTSLTEITLPDTLTGIYKSAFAGTTALGSVSIPDGVAVIDSGAFDGSGITEITFGENSKLKTIGSNAFANTARLEKVSIPLGVTEIREKTFYNSGVKTVAVSDSVNYIGRLAFAGAKIGAIDIPLNVTEIGYSAFKDAESLAKITFADNGKSMLVRDEAFYNTAIDQIDIPANINYVGNLCFAKCKNLTAITVAEKNQNYASVDGVFYNKACTKLISCPAGKTGSYTVSDAVISFASGAFEGSQLSEIIIPNESKLMTIGLRTFYKCDNLTHITIPDSVQSIEYYAFAYCENLEQVDVNAGSQLGGIYSGAFYNCAKLTGITIPDSVKEISDYAFYGCSALTNVTLSENSKLQGVYDHAFEYAGIENFDMPAEMMVLGAYAFRGAKLKTFTFNEKLEEIGEYALAESGLTETTELVVPSSVEYIERGILKGVRSLEELTLPFLGATEINSERNNTIEYTFCTNGVNTNWPDDLDNLKKLSILSGDHLDGYAFKTMKVQEIYLPSSLIDIGYCAFWGCQDLNNIIIPNNVRSMGSQAFMLCSSIKNIIIPQNCSELASEVFADCYSLKSVTIPKNISYIAEDAFDGCSSLEDICLDDDNKFFKIYDKILYDYNMTRIVVVPKKINGIVQIPDGVKSIDSSAFFNCENIDEVIMPDTVTEIGENSFAGCEKLSKVKFSKHLNHIGKNAFSCTGIVDIILPNNVTAIDEGAFWACKNLESIVFPDSLEYISSSMLYADSKLKKIQFGENLKKIGRSAFMACTELESCILPESVENIEDTIFEACTNLKYVYLGKNVKSIGAGIFKDCDSLQQIIVDEENEYFFTKDGILYDSTVTNIIYIPKDISGKIEIPYGIKKIDAFLFYGHKNITEIILPETVKTIGDSAFAYCTNLKKIRLGDEISEIGGNAFYDTAFSNEDSNYEDGILYIGEYVVGSKSGKTTIKIKAGTRLIAFSSLGGSELRKVIMPDSLEIIDAYNFAECKKLKYVKWSKNLKYIGEGAFWNSSIESVILEQKCHIDSPGCFSNTLRYCYLGKDNSVWFDEYVYGNIESYVGTYYSQPGVNANNIIFEDREQCEHSNFFPDGVNIYTREDKDSKILDKYKDNNNIYYGDEWSMLTFYVDGIVVRMIPQINGTIVQTPSQTEISDILPEGATFLGWDINGDGKVDELPATLTSDLEAHAVYSAPITSIEMKSELSLEVDETQKLEVEINPSGYNQSDKLTWESADNSIATVADGKVTGGSEGQTTIKAVLDANKQVYAECTVTVTPKTYGIKLSETETTINVGDTYSITPDVIVPDGDTDKTAFASDDTDIATVDNKGVITGVAPGNAAITVSHGMYSAEFAVTVKQPMTSVVINQTEKELNVGDTFTLTAAFEPANTTDDKSVFWYSKDTSVAKVDSDGLVTAIAPGTVDVCGAVGNFRISCSVTVKAPIEKIVLNTTKGTLRLDRTKQLDVIYIPSNTTDDRDVVWSSADPEIASVDENGLVTGLKTGKTTITGTVGTHTATYTVSVIGIRDAKTGITITNSDDTEMGDDTTVEVVRENPDMDGEYGHYVRKIKVDINGRIYIIYIYDITLKRGGATIQPDKLVDVDIPMPDGAPEKGVGIYRLEEDGSMTDMNPSCSDGKYSFQTEHFSVYCVAVPTDEYQAAKVETDTDSVDMCVGKTATITATVLPENAENKQLTYVSGDENVATVDENGNVSAVSVGETTVTVKSVVDGVQAVVNVNVREHTWNDGEVTTAPTCTKAGVKTFTCTACGETRTEDIKATGHTVVVDEAVAPTCTETGLTEGSHCSVCNEVIKAQEEVAALGHTWDDGEVTTAPTCTKTGVKTFTCDTCGETRTEDIKATGHTVIVDEAVAPTCTEPGLTEGSHCSVCNEVIKAQEEVAALGHTWDDGEVTTAPTCTETGVRTFTCATCGETRTEDIKATGHALVVDEAVAPTCTETGLTEGSHCSVCNEVIKAQEEVPALGHTWDDGEITTAPTCTKTGVKTYTCTACGQTRTEDIKATGHTAVTDKAIAPTCTETGLTEGIHCSVCNEVIKAQEEVAALGHKWDSGKVTKKPTYTAKGTKTYTCTVCSDTKTEDIPVLKRVDITKAASRISVAGIENKIYNGKAQTQAKLVVKANGRMLTKGTNYTVTYKNNKNIGTATLTITGKNGYTGTIKKTFAIKTQAGKVYGSTLKYKITSAKTNGTGTVSLIGSGYSKTNKKFTTLKIADTVIIGGVKFKITKIENKAFMKYHYLTNVVVGSNVTGIGDYAFYGCPRLATVTVGKNIRTIGTKAFYGCKSLKSVKILSPKLVKAGTSAFAGIKANAAFALPKKYYNSYGRLIKKAGAPKKAVYKKF